MRGNMISRRMRSGCASATAASALNPSLAVTTSMRSRCSVNWTILRTVGLSSTTNTTGLTVSLTSSQHLLPVLLPVYVCACQMAGLLANICVHDNTVQLRTTAHAPPTSPTPHYSDLPAAASRRQSHGGTPPTNLRSAAPNGVAPLHRSPFGQTPTASGDETVG